MARNIYSFIKIENVRQSAVFMHQLLALRL